MALALRESSDISTSAIFKANKLNLQGVNNAIFDGIYSNKDTKMPIAGFFCFDAQKYQFSLIFTLIVTKISNHHF